MELIIVVGWHGTEIVREAVYEMLNEKFRVRRNTKNLWWDLSVPLTILGYKDKKRYLWRWIMLCLKAAFYLLIGPKSPHKIILNLNTSDQNTADYWTGFIKPDFLLIVNQKSKTRLIDNLIVNTEKNSGIIIYDPSMTDIEIKKMNRFTFGKKPGVDLRMTESKTSVIYKYKKESVKLSYSILPKFASHLMGSALSLAVHMRKSMTNACFAALRVDFHSKLISKIISNI